MACKKASWSQFGVGVRSSGADDGGRGSRSMQLVQRVETATVGVVGRWSRGAVGVVHQGLRRWSGAE
jgi:hypothetical protein